jgi:peptide/nickel transport system substrate-binding protein
LLDCPTNWQKETAVHGSEDDVTEGADGGLLEQLEEGGFTRAGVLKAGAIAAVGATVLGRATGVAHAADAAGAIGAAKPKRGGTLQWAIGDSSTKDTVDPHRTLNNTDSILGMAVFETLLYADQKFRLVPGLAKAWESNARSTIWTFKLQSGVRFHDGTPMTAKDVAWSLKRVLDKATGSPVYARLSASLDPTGIKVIDNTTIILTLKRPDALLPLALTQRHVAVIKNGQNAFAEGNAIGTGPFKLKSFRAGESWEAVRNPNYWRKGLPYLDGMRQIKPTDQTAKVQSVISGSAHISDTPDFGVLASVKSNKAVKLFAVPASQFYVIAMDENVKPFDDKRVRLAIKLATDRNKILKTALRGFGTVTADVPVPSFDPTYPARPATAKQNIKKAKQLLAQAGHPNGIDVELFVAPVGPGMVDIAVVFAETVRAAGIRVKVTQWSDQTYFDDVWLKKPMYVDFFARRHAQDILSVAYAKSAPWNESHYDKNGALDKTLDKALATKDSGARDVLYRKTLATVAEESGMLIPAFLNQNFVAKRNVQNAFLGTSRFSWRNWSDFWLAS